METVSRLLRPRGSAPSRIVVLQPMIAAGGFRWLDRIARAHGFDTWAEAAALVLARIAGDPSDPVNGHAFTRADVPRARTLFAGWDFREGRPIRIMPGGRICVRLSGPVAGHAEAITGLRSNAAAAAVLGIARRLDPAGTRYHPTEAVA